MRATLDDTARKAQSSISRGTLRELNSKPEWSEAKQVDAMKSETHSDVEYIENYGGTSVPAKQDKEEEDQKQQQQSQDRGGSPGAGDHEPEIGEQPQGDSAECIICYVGGNHSHPVILAIGDRRHRLVELEEGDVASHRMKDDRQEVLLHKDGTYVSTRVDKVYRIALVPKKKQEQQQPGQQQQANGAGGGTSGSGSGKEKKKKEYGQKSAREDNKKSEVSIEQNGQVTTSQHGQAYAAQKGGSDSSTYWENRKKSTQVTEEHTHIRFKDNILWNDKDGNWMCPPILVKKDQYCKE
jgi:phage gp45-like